MKEQSEKPKVNLKQHQRFRRQVPWALIRKLVIVVVLIGLFYYWMNSLPPSETNNSSEIEVSVE